MSDAERVARHAIRNAMTATSDVTGLRAGPGVDRLVDQILVELLSPPVRWAILDLAAEACATSPKPDEPEPKRATPPLCCAGNFG